MAEQHQILPEGISPEDEIAVLWHRDEDGNTKIVAELGGAKVTIETDENSVPLVPWLVASTPNILEAAWQAIEGGNEQQEEA